MLSPSTWANVTPEVTIRRARREDGTLLDTLAELDSAPSLHGDALIAEQGHTPVAAIELETGRAVADPFRPSAPVVELLRLRAAQLR